MQHMHVVSKLIKAAGSIGMSSPCNRSDAFQIVVRVTRPLQQQNQVHTTERARTYAHVAIDPRNKPPACMILHGVDQAPSNCSGRCWPAAMHAFCYGSFSSPGRKERQPIQAASKAHRGIAFLL
jgi:hypothetical protein